MEQQKIDFTNNDFIVFEQFGDSSAVSVDSGQNMRQRFSATNMVVLLVCYQGNVELTLGRRTYKASAGQGYALLPTSVVEQVRLSPDVHLRGFGFAVTAMESMRHTNRQTWEEALSLNDNPLVTLTEPQMQVLEHLYHIALLGRQMTENRRYRLMMRSLAQSVIYMLAEVISHSSDDGDRVPSATEKYFKRFIQLLWATGGTEREVSYFANKMCISPKYLSIIVHGVCGKTPIQIIHSYTANMIAQWLQNTDLSIKEIAKEMNFTNVSFFARFVRQHLGFTPREYRNRMKSKGE